MVEGKIHVNGHGTIDLSSVDFLYPSLSVLTDFVEGVLFFPC